MRQQFWCTVQRPDKTHLVRGWRVSRFQLNWVLVINKNCKSNTAMCTGSYKDRWHQPNTKNFFFGINKKSYDLLSWKHFASHSPKSTSLQQQIEQLLCVCDWEALVGIDLLIWACLFNIRNLQYIQKKGLESFHTMKGYPTNMEKKVRLMTFFRNYMKQHLLKVRKNYQRVSILLISRREKNYQIFDWWHQYKEMFGCYMYNNWQLLSTPYE